MIRLKTKDLILISLFSALITVGAFIKIPTPLCPITLQILFTTLAGVIAGGKNGAISVIVYILTGLVGFPVFAGGGGIRYIFQPTFGFLVGMIIGTYITGKICHSGNTSFKRLLIGCLVGLVPTFAIGTAYNCLITSIYLKEQSAAIVIFYCLLPLPWDIILCVFSAYIGKKTIKHIKAV